MNRQLDPFPGGEGCPLEDFRRRVLRALWTMVALGLFGFVFALTWLPEPGTTPTTTRPELRR